MRVSAERSGEGGAGPGGEGCGDVGGGAEEAGEAAVVRGAPAVGDGGGLEEVRLPRTIPARTARMTSRGIGPGMRARAAVVAPPRAMRVAVRVVTDVRADRLVYRVRPRSPPPLHYEITEVGAGPGETFLGHLTWAVRATITNAAPMPST